jgi:hypothetical protein
MHEFVIPSMSCGGKGGRTRCAHHRSNLRHTVEILKRLTALVEEGTLYDKDAWTCFSSPKASRQFWSRLSRQWPFRSFKEIF